jgi:hypothetical protein
MDLFADNLVSTIGFLAGPANQRFLVLAFGSGRGSSSQKQYLSFPKIISGRIGGAVQPGWKWWQWRQIVEPLDAKAHLSLDRHTAPRVPGSVT